MVEPNLNREFSEDIPIELLQSGVSIHEKEVLEHDILILEVLKF
jgi:hypothetical protein